MLADPVEVPEGKPQSLSPRTSRIHRRDFVPLKVCAKYSPPAIAILYSLAHSPQKKFLHEIPLPLSSKTSAELYQQLLKAEPIYLNPQCVAEAQILRVIDQIKAKAPNGYECSTAAASNTNCEEMNKKMDEVVVPMITDKSKLKDELQKELKTGAADSVGDEYSEDFAEESSDNAKPSSELPLQKSETAPKNANPAAPEEDIDYGKMDQAMEGEELPEGFQRVFVEDLGEELLMDPNGNLYDLNGNLIGQAASDDEGEEKEGGEKEGGEKAADAVAGEDDKYFENSVEIDADGNNQFAMNEQLI